MAFKKAVLLHIVFNVVLLCALLSAQTDGAVPTFSGKHGFFDKAFDLVVSSPLPNCKIALTLDGSDPLISSNSIIADSSHTLRIDPSSKQYRAATPCVTVRAALMQNGEFIGPSKTQTYIFLDQVLHQSSLGERPGADWPRPTTNGQIIDYGMDLSVIKHPSYQFDIKNALLDIPSLSIVTDLKNLFDRDNGIYVNAQYHGIEWERPASVELINPDGTEGFQINCGLRIRGGWSRHYDNPKHAFRLFFRSDYGEAKLRYPLFGDECVDEFDKMDLRTSQNYSWSYKGDVGSYNTMTRDVYSRDLQRDMGQPYTRSRYYHLYLNGMYWGLYQTQERPEAAFAASYFGGEREDYDVVKMDIGDNWNIYEIEATDGTLEAWQKIWQACEKGFWNNGDYFRLQGRRWNGDPDPDGTALVDIDNLIDYMIIIFYTGNFDAPVSKFRSNNDPNNFYAIYNRKNNRGFMFFAHDAEHTLLPDPVNVGDGIVEDRVSIGFLNGSYRMNVNRFEKFHPQWLHHQLSMNREYMTRFGDRVHSYFFNNGVLTPTHAAKPFQNRADEIDLAIIAESVRWGDSKFFRARTKNEDWLPAVNNVLANWFPRRSDIVLEQLRSVGLYPDMQAPQFISNGNTILDTLYRIDDYSDVSIANPNLNFGEILYTLDGTDPRKIGGQAAETALQIEAEVPLQFEKTTLLKARLFADGKWSALQQCRFVKTDGLSGLRLTEIHYHPMPEGDVSHRDLEFIELKNIGSSSIQLDSLQFVSGVSFTFPKDDLAPNDFVVLASNAQAFEQRYGFAPYGQYIGQLNNQGDLLQLVQPDGAVLFSIQYKNNYPWPASADGTGHSLVAKMKNPLSSQASASAWAASQNIHGSPGADDPASQSESASSTSTKSNQLYQNYPNPFVNRTTIRFSIREQGRTTIKIYNVLGQYRATILDSDLAAGVYNVEWDATHYPTGIYFYVLQTANHTKVNKLLRVK